MELFSLLLIISIFTHCVRTIYEILKHKNIINPENKILFSIIFSNMALLWISWFGLCFTDPNKINLNPLFKYLGAVFLIFGMILFALSLAKIKRFENYHGDLITTGIYKYIRHPMYLSFIFWLAGGSLFNQSVIALLLTLFYTANILVWKKFEEIHLLNTFPKYKEYIKSTYGI